MSSNANWQPLAARMRPRSMEDFVGQGHILGNGKPLRTAIESGVLHSMILWGPPGTGKTSLARVIASSCDAHFENLSAVLSGVKDIRAAIATATQERKERGRGCILFVDEAHRFNKAQQDAFLPFVEDGTVVFIGATTENPSFELNNALLSRARVYVMKGLDESSVCELLQRALENDDELARYEPTIETSLLLELARAADGDARRALNLLELAVGLASQNDAGQCIIDESIVTELLSGSTRRFDKGGDAFFDQISALHKSVRGSSPDAALYWLNRMLDGGCDPHYLARRVLRMASEDIGLADPRALSICLDAWQALERLGSPEGELALAEAVVYLACAAKSNAIYKAFSASRSEVDTLPGYEVPLHLRNAPTRLTKALGHGKSYRYAHDEPNAYAAGEHYFPDELRNRQYYRPTERGLEKKIAEKLAFLRELDEQTRK